LISKEERRVMRVLRSRKLIALAAAVVVAAAGTGVGLSAVLSRTTLADVTNIHYSIVKFVANDYDSGWIMHPGIVIVQVQEGSLQITQGSCTPKTVGPGETFIKVPYVPVRGVSTGRVVFTATFLVPYELPLIMPATNPCP
jgi:hypothetical protein